MNAAAAVERDAVRAEPHDTIRENEAFALGYQAAVWGYPYVKGMLLRKQATHPASRNHAPINDVHRYTALARPGFHDFTPTVEALMHVGWLDLAQGPVLVELPPIEGRYWSVVVTDAVGETGEYVGSRLGSPAGTYAYVRSDWQGALPAGARRIDVRSRFALLLLRMLVHQGVEDDLDACVRLGAALRLRPLEPSAAHAASERGSAPPSARPDAPVFHSLAFFEALNQALAEDGIMPGEAVVAAQFAHLGIASGRPFDAEALTDAQRRGLLRGLQAATQRITAQLQWGAQLRAGWAFLYQVGRYGDDFLMRAAAALFGFGAMVPQETLYICALTDCTGAPLDGANQAYRIRFAPGQLPQVDAFWSVTLYTRPGNQLVDNLIDRYSISSQTAGLQHTTDGALTIDIRHGQPPADVSNNWLPAPAGPFWLVLRTYVPQAALLKHAYTPPQIERLTAAS